MKAFINYLPFITIVIMLTACGDNTNNKLIVGNWQATEWLINGQPSEANVKNTSFRFNDKGRYSFTNSGRTEEGTYKVENEMLFTTPANQQEMMVKISKLSGDSLVFDMNRGGQPEILTLVKTK